jgi:hypothetical protein
MTDNIEREILSIRHLILQYDSAKDKNIEGQLIFRATNCLLTQLKDIKNTETYKTLAYYLADKLYWHTYGMGSDKRTEFAAEIESYFRRALLLARQALSHEDRNLKKFIEGVIYYERFIDNKSEVDKLESELKLLDRK